MATYKKVLSIDGGGIRGLIPALFLEKLEKEVKKPIWEIFDLIVGTSTGGILALGLTVPEGYCKAQNSASKLVDLYSKHGDTIFSRPLTHRMKAAGNWLEEKYPDKGLYEVLEKFFKNAKLSEALRDVVIPAYEIERRIPWFFKSRHAKNPERQATYDYSMIEVARATSAAPTYFEPVRVEAAGDDYYAFIDGGMFANNPAMCAYVEAQTMFPKDQILLVSLGTGELTRRIPYAKACKWGIRGWARPALDVNFDGVSDTVHYQLSKLIKPKQYFRWQVSLNEANDAMDDASPRNLRHLRLQAEQMIRETSQRLSSLCEILSEV
jgi:uncharacterized protein